MKLAILIITSLVVTAISAKEITIGRTWDIIEPDPIAEAKKRAANIPPEKLVPKRTYRTRLAAKGISRTSTPKIRMFSPSHTLKQQIVDKDGQVLYPAGFKYNPIKFMRVIKKRIIIIDEDDALFVKPLLRPSDVVIVNKGELKKVSQILQRKITMLDILTAEAMNIKKVPVVVNVDFENFYYELNEFIPDLGVPL